MSANDLAVERSGESRRVALLAKAGQARDLLRKALEEAGANVVLEEDPNNLQCDDLKAAGPQVVLVALEPSSDDSLSRFDSVLNDPAVAVIYDEAELAARREGWEAQRWARHLRAKLNGHADVLPPGGELETAQPEPGRPASPAQLHEGARMEMHLEEAQALSVDLPLGGLQPPVRAAEMSLYTDLEPEAWEPRGEALSLEAVAEAEVAAPPRAALASAPLALELEIEGAPVRAGSAPEASVKPQTRRGALLLFAGIGGPDAVRKVLAELPAGLSRPVLVQLRLDGGRYDNLVKQMARVSVLPVELAVAGKPAQPRRVYVLPDDVAMDVVEGVVHFVEGQADLDALIAALPPAESAVLVLSGGDASQVDAVMALGEKGAFVAGQSHQGCYDAVASKALSARGGTTGTPAELAASAVAHLGA